jgi:MoaA/NifB/PqqE/SkfB family radical SAM enzyme
VTISGGEPLLHPELDEIIRRIRKNGMISGLITNGYLLVAERIERLNRAGLEWLQISIDNVTPDEVSKKSLKVLDKKLELLAEYADFHVNINSVVGGGVCNPQDALTIGKRALTLGFSSTIGIIHDSSGQLQPLTEEEKRVYQEMKAMEKSSFTRVNAFQDNIALGRPNQWRCRAGARYLYIC